MIPCSTSVSHCVDLLCRRAENVCEALSPQSLFTAASLQQHPLMSAISHGLIGSSGIPASGDCCRSSLSVTGPRYEAGQKRMSTATCLVWRHCNSSFRSCRTGREALRVSYICWDVALLEWHIKHGSLSTIFDVGQSEVFLFFFVIIKIV